jgi:hypothetical protein
MGGPRQAPQREVLPGALGDAGVCGTVELRQQLDGFGRKEAAC